MSYGYQYPILWYNNQHAHINIPYGHQSSVSRYNSQHASANISYRHYPSTSDTVLNYSNHVYSKSRISSWIIYTDATDHMCGTNIQLTNIQPCHLTRVDLSNSNSPLVSSMGSIQLNKHLTLHNVLQIPNFHVNLLSIPKSTQSINYPFSFYSNKCSIHDPQGMLIGMGRREYVLYILDECTPF